MSDRPEKPVRDVRSVQTADNARLEYEIVGSGPPLVLLHGILSGRHASRASARHLPISTV
ncbi:MAG TPA: hypothetical protein VLJ20_04660 [Acetobacteraceae bacterium]|nr:hypothetical protein [Acetobacteraceae bacterium]